MGARKEARQSGIEGGPHVTGAKDRGEGRIGYAAVSRDKKWTEMMVAGGSGKGMSLT